MTKTEIQTMLEDEKLIVVTEVLRGFGWHYDRKINITKTIEIYEGNNWHVFPKAKELLEIFDGLPPIVFPIHNELFFGGNKGYEEPYMAADWKAASGEDILPIGSYDISGIYMETSGKVYEDAEYTGNIYLLGYDIYEAIYNLIFGEYIQKFTYECTN